MSDKSFYIKTFGCQMNERDSEIMSQSLSAHGYIEAMDIKSADLIILNTCSIRAKAEQKVMSMLGYLRKTKENKPQLKICVAGCVAQQEGKKILSKMNHVDLIIGTQNIYNIGELLAETSVSSPMVATTLDDRYQIPNLAPRIFQADRGHIAKPAPFRKFVTIMQGCNNYCTYCVVPYTRGREISRISSDIIREVNVLVTNGVKEITLLGQNVNSYGRTNSVNESTDNYSFADLLHEVSRTDGLKRLRFTTSNPKDLTDDLIHCFRDIDNLCPQFHLPVQAGSDSVLKKMNRKYSVRKYLELVEKLRQYCPEIAITTDVIVGFPGESDEDFEGTMNLLEEIRYHGSFSFKYSDRPGTRAAAFDGKIDESLKSERLARFQKRQDEISLERNREYVGQWKTVMVEESSDKGVKCRTNTNHIVHLPASKKVCPGDFLNVTVTHAGHHSLKGEQCHTSSQESSGSPVSSC
ncbi:MAG: tRNA (N6-isopentenyl adenosine(37)-C2)-methylthiotransferase MiaB [Deltaproteobacteria bacterium]|nr:tRNA (N6-isopentenyl adenosine(37)-C2)-methylthiotransferase MiaB [Deltaproteobacteria bacterium]